MENSQFYDGMKQLNLNPNPNSTNKQHTIVRIQWNIDTWSTFPLNLARYNVAPLSQLRAVNVTMPRQHQTVHVLFNNASSMQYTKVAQKLGTLYVRLMT